MNGLAAAWHDFVISAPFSSGFNVLSVGCFDVGVFVTSRINVVRINVIDIVSVREIENEG